MRNTDHMDRSGSSQMSAASGFSLLELIIAFTILGLMAGVVFSSFRLVLNSYDKGQERMETEARKRVLQEQIRRQIGSLFPVRPSGSFLEPQEVASQGQQPVPPFSQVPLFYGTPDSVTFTTVAPLMLQVNPGLTIVRYGLAQDEWGNYYLGAMEARYMGLDSFMSMVNSPRGKPLPLVESVGNLEFQYYGYDSESESYQWVNSWIGDEMSAVPEAIRIAYDDDYVLVSINASFYGTQAMQGFRRFVRR